MRPFNLWHDLEPGTVDKINVIIEINRGSKNKYEIDKQTGLIKLDRAMHTAQDFPFDYGFVPQTLWHDDDPLDVVVLATYPLLPGILVRVRPVAFLKMTDDGAADDKIIAVPIDDPRWDKVKDLPDLNPHLLKEISHFYSTYKELQGKKVAVEGFADKKAATQAFQQGVELHKDKYSDSLY